MEQQLKRIQDKLQQLLKQYNRLQKENERLKEELQHSKSKDTETQRRMEELGQQVSILKVASGEMSEKDKKDFEKKINQYVREIDKCISFLSQ